MVDDAFYRKWKATVRGVAERHYHATPDHFCALTLLDADDVEQELWLLLCESSARNSAASVKAICVRGIRHMIKKAERHDVLLRHGEQCSRPAASAVGYW